MLAIWAALFTLSLPAESSTITAERIDVFDPLTGAYLGSEQTYLGPDGRRLRLDVTDADGASTLLLFVLHDQDGREAEAIYFESGELTPYRETFTYADDGPLLTTTYYSELGDVTGWTEADLDADGREVRKRYYRADSSQYGEEDVLWNTDETKRGWDFRRIERSGAAASDGVASFRYAYQAFDGAGRWTIRTRSRDGVAERVEARTLATTDRPRPFMTAAPLAPGTISTSASETSPSFSRDGRVMVFARYGDDWSEKIPFVARLTDDGWGVERIPGVGPVYNLAVSPDGERVVYAVGSNGPLLQVRYEEGTWSEPESLTAQYGVSGSYPALTDAGDLLVYKSDGSAGNGIYVARRRGEGLGPNAPLYVPDEGTTFDGVVSSVDEALLVTRCLDDVCDPGDLNGVWAVELGVPEGPTARKIAALPYVWGVQPVEALRLLVFTDGEDILAVPLEAAGLSGRANEQQSVSR
ncbi:MAG: hypothetical protein AAF089_07495 [Bacteroidota bacterium]